MDTFNSLIHTVKGAMPIVQSGIPAIVGGFVTAMFLRGNTQRAEFEKIKAGKIQEAVDDLVKSHELTLTELVKCKNLLQIAELAEREYKTKSREHKTKMNEEFDFDWFLRFFEAAGNINNRDMQILWARILAGEVYSRGTFSLRTIETLRNMTQYEAKMFHAVVPLILTDGNDIMFIYRGDYDHSEGCLNEINELYGFGPREFAVMEECGLLRPQSYINYINSIEGIPCIYNGNICLVFKLIMETNHISEKYISFNNYQITRTAMQLITITDTLQDDQYILNLGLLFRRKYPDFIIKAHRIVNIEEGKIILDFNTDLLE